MNQQIMFSDEGKTSYTCYWENPNNARYYHTRVLKDLLGDMILSICWGTKGSKLGRVEYKYCKNVSDLIEALKKIENNRRCHSYIKL